MTKRETWALSQDMVVNFKENTFIIINDCQDFTVP